MISNGAIRSLLLRNLPRRGLQGTSSTPHFSPTTSTHFSVRFFSDKDKSSEVSDPFGVNFADGPEGIGPSKPPAYIRDETTGHFTGEIEPESQLSPADQRFLKAEPAESEQIFMDHIEEQYRKKGGKQELNALGERVRASNMATNIFGRSPKAQASVEELGDGITLGRDETGVSKHLTEEEFKTFQTFASQEHEIKVQEDDIPTESSSSNTKRSIGASIEADSESKELALKWLTSRAQRQMDDILDDNPFSDVMPGDLTPSRLVNRRQAKKIPKELLHHNNVSLLRTFMTDAGLIRHRVQTRLGARDQRRVAKLIKRARALGLMPYVGQFKVENHGWVNAPDIDENREWETELENRGLVIKDDDQKPNYFIKESMQKPDSNSV